VTKKNKKKKSIVIIIPARLKSTRLKNKLLKLINGVPMIILVAKNALKTNIGKVLVATDSLRIKSLCIQHCIDVVLTNKKHRSGTDRIFEAYNISRQKADLIINLQGDLPYFKKELLLKTINLFQDENTEISSAVCNLKKDEEKDENVVKAHVKLDKLGRGFAIDFKRKIEKSGNFYHHIGVYIYRPETLKNFILLKQTKNERDRKLEQMRAMDNSFKIKLVKVSYNPPSIDTKEDLKKIRLLFRAKKY